ncbi:MAG: DUF2279 domain-containing protein [Bacteroidales bacterium]|nr:DUF2279 domain-containing protein [Bacteroidales bacterium]
MQKHFFELSKLRSYLTAVFCLIYFEGNAQKAPETTLKDHPQWLVPAEEFHSKRFTGLVTSITVGYAGALIGLNELWYKDYPRSSFHFINDAKEWQQIDKAGHVVTPYLEARYIMQLYEWSGVDHRKAAWYGGLTAFVMQNTIEIFDGFSKEWGASLPDIGANFVGASVMVGQELLWNEQRISLKVMPSYVNYSDPELQQRSNQLFGSNYLQRFIKDYNAINVWVSVNPASFNSKQRRLKWLNVAVGYGAGGMFGGYDNQWTDASGNFHNRDDIQRYRKLLVSLDIDLSRVPTRSRYMRLLLDALNIIKVPAPTLEWNSKGEILFHPLM